jgi:hypothetical protein
LNLTNDQFDEVEIREVSCFGAVLMKSESGLPNTFLRSATANRFSWSFRSICYCGSAMGVTHSCECARRGDQPIVIQSQQLQKSDAKVVFNLRATAKGWLPAPPCARSILQPRKRNSMKRQ